MIITLQDARGFFYCTKGIRLFFKKYNLDYHDFRLNGIEEQTLINTNDSMAIAIVENKNGRK